MANGARVRGKGVIQIPQGENKRTIMTSQASAPQSDATREFARIGLLSFGGPAAQIALMHKVLVEERAWLSEQQFLNALSFCMLLPGPEAMQLATYAGWRLNGTLGGIIAGMLFVIPGAIVIGVLAALYAYFGNLPLMHTLFLGIKAAVLIIVLEALLKVSRKALVSRMHWVIAGLAFVGIFFLELPFPFIIAIAALFGAFAFAKTPPQTPLREALVPWTTTLRTIVTWLVIWIVPLLAIDAVAGTDILGQIGAFFSRLAVVTFGGAYAVLAYMAQDVVTQFGWLTAGEMLDGLGLAETTPGPLILVTEFVGFLAGYREGGLWLGILAALVTLWATFVPCFLWIFAGAPYIEWIAHQPRLSGALSAITAAVVGVILNLSIWFALHVFFTSVSRQDFMGLTYWQPELASLDWRVVVLAFISGVLLLRAKLGVAFVLTISAFWALVISAVF